MKDDVIKDFFADKKQVIQDNTPHFLIESRQHPNNFVDIIES